MLIIYNYFPFRFRLYGGNNTRHDPFLKYTFYGSFLKTKRGVGPRKNRTMDETRGNEERNKEEITVNQERENTISVESATTAGGKYIRELQEQLLEEFKKALEGAESRIKSLQGASNSTKDSSPSSAGGNSKTSESVQTTPSFAGEKRNRAQTPSADTGEKR